MLCITKNITIANGDRVQTCQIIWPAQAVHFVGNILSGTPVLSIFGISAYFLYLEVTTGNRTFYLFSSTYIHLDTAMGQNSNFWPLLSLKGLGNWTLEFGTGRIIWYLIFIIIISLNKKTIFPALIAAIVFIYFCK